MLLLWVCAEPMLQAYSQMRWQWGHAVWYIVDRTEGGWLISYTLLAVYTTVSLMCPGYIGNMCCFMMCVCFQQYLLLWARRKEGW
jgi:hypothetical protein